MIIFVHLFDDYSGSPRVLRDSITSLADLDLSLMLLVGKNEGFLNGLSIQKKVHLYKKTTSKLVQSIIYFLAQVDIFFKVRSAVKESKKKGEDSLVVINTVMPIGAALGAYFSSAKTLLIMHETTFRPAILKKIYRFIFCRTVDDVVYVSRFLMEAEFLKGPRLHLLSNGLRDDFTSNPDINLRKKFDGRTVLFVGSLKKYKGIDQFIKLAMLLPDFNFKAALNCDEQEAQVYFSQSDIPSNLIFEIRPENLQELYSSSFILVNLSLPDQWVETFGLTILEGMHFGCPVVVPQIGGHRDYVSTCHGILEDSNNLESIVKFIRELSKDFDSFSILSKACMTTSKAYSYKATSDASKHFFKSLVS